MSGHDPIERMREVFESIEPGDGAVRRWEEKLSAVSRQPSAEGIRHQASGTRHQALGTGQQARSTFGTWNSELGTLSPLSPQSSVLSPLHSPVPEPLPWRLLIGSASAAAASIALLAVGVFDPPAQAPNLAAAPVEVTRVAMTAAGPVMDAPAPDGTKWHLHWPSLGVDVKGSLEMISTAFLAPFGRG